MEKSFFIFIKKHKRTILKEFIDVVKQGCQNKCGNGTLNLEDDLSCRMGFSHKLKLVFSNCDWDTHKFTSSNCKSSILEDTPVAGPGRQLFEVNVCSVLSFRESEKVTKA